MKKILGIVIISSLLVVNSSEVILATEATGSSRSGASPGAKMEQVKAKIEEKTLGKVWNIPYEFKVFYSNDENDNLFQPIGKACAGNKKSKSYIIPTTKGPLTVKLDICS